MVTYLMMTLIKILLNKIHHMIRHSIVYIFEFMIFTIEDVLAREIASTVSKSVGP